MSPVNVMAQFKKVFLDSSSRKSWRGRINENIKIFMLFSRHKVYRLRKNWGC